MTTLLWDQVGQRLYETGLDRGVLYLADDTGVPWNGLTGVEEDASDDTTEPVYFDGVKYLDEQKFGDFAATLKAFTYPDEFLEYEGLISLGNGMYVDGQAAKVFGLSYRTLVGNDIDGTDHGYQIHLLYNLTVSQDATTYSTLSNQSAATEFSWSITAVPVQIDGYRPTAHVILDSRFLPADVLVAVEKILYGSDGSSGELIYDGGDADSSGDTVIYDGGTPPLTGPDELDGGFPGSIVIDIPGGELSSGTIDGGDAGSSGIPLSSGVEEPSVARLPPISELFNIVTLWGPKIIEPDIVTGLSALIPGSGDITSSNIPGLYTELPTSRLIESATPGLFTLVV